MNKIEMHNKNRISKRITIILGVILAITTTFILIIMGKRFSWKNKFELTYLGMWESYYGNQIGDKYSVYNKTNNTYLISAIYIIANGKEIKLRDHETIRPHSEVEIKIAYNSINDELGEDNYFYDIVVIGFEYEKK